MKQFQVAVESKFSMIIITKLLSCFVLLSSRSFIRVSSRKQDHMQCLSMDNTVQDQSLEFLSES